jgi:hypothetical protein
MNGSVFIGYLARLIDCVTCAGRSAPVRKAGCAHAHGRANISKSAEILMAGGDCIAEAA